MDLLILILSLFFSIHIVKNKKYNLDFVLCQIIFICTIIKYLFLLNDTRIRQVAHWTQIALILVYFVVVMIGSYSKKINTTTDKRNTIIKIAAIAFLIVRIVKEYFFRVMLSDIIDHAFIVSENNSHLIVLTVCSTILNAMEIIIISLIFFVYTKRNKNDKIIQ